MNIWIIDTSSVIEIRRQLPADATRAACEELDAMVYRGVLTFPPQVLEELERITEAVTKKRGADTPFEWAKRNEQRATRYGRVYDRAREVLARVPNLIDPDKVSIGGVDDADPYVIATALAVLDEGNIPRILTEDFNTTPHKTALADAAGLFHVPCVRFRTFLRDLEIWPSR